MFGKIKLLHGWLTDVYQHKNSRAVIKKNLNEKLQASIKN